MRVAPYINGRLIDEGTATWSANFYAGELSTAKNNSGVLNSTMSNLKTYDESNESGAKLTVMCPYTKFWQETISDACDKVVNYFGADMVFIDQIASAEPHPCWDHTHGHPIGGGNFWYTGNGQMLDSA